MILDFNDLMDDFYDCIKQSEDTDLGAVFYLAIRNTFLGDTLQYINIFEM